MQESSSLGVESEVPVLNSSEKSSFQPPQSLSTSPSFASTTTGTISLADRIATGEIVEKGKAEKLSSTDKASVPNASPRMRTFANPSGRGVSLNMNRNTLINGDNMLQRQLREKAKQDSLESIKMHILMRLNLKKLPNITKPISVPQNIIEDFYKGYNASLSSSGRRRNSESSASASLPSFNKNLHSETLASDVSVSGESENLSTQMQGDDANANSLNQFKINNDRNGDAGTEFGMDDEDDVGSESILSHVSSIYLFPEQPQSHMRHRKTDVLRFKFDSSYTDVSHATLHLYLRGWDWINAHQPELIDEISSQQNKDIVVAIHRAVRRTNGTSFTHKAKMFEFSQPIPSGQGQWINVDLKPLFGLTLAGVTGRGSNGSQEILIKGVESWMKQLVVTTDNTSKNSLTVHIEIGSKKKHRRKRSLMDCTESDQDVRCCRYPLRVNFTSFGWNFVVAPTSFDAYFCSGDCRVGYLEQYPHTHLAALTTSASPCCSPTKMSSLSLLYFDDNHNLVLSVIPNMSVEECSCS
ncbi:uncharacterized protein Dwil_GK13592 [Drosophila willistoni]|uniref:TGF-beta family profile domain-containing protein n=2 Tax=Drosophila willistoni TaxID=7260 RepID=B4NHV6_DROWI|nr:uncharacterized protein Dwil_GK13592 [Drosophila willistoni]